MEQNYIIGMDIGGTKCAAILGSASCPAGESPIIDKIKFDTEVKKGYKQAVDRFFHAIDELLRRNGVRQEAVKSVGISCGGPVDSRRGLILSPPNLVGWDRVPITKLVTDRYHIPAYLQNDANACAVAEWKYGAAQGYSNVVFLTMGTGMGAGLILDGRLYSGTNDMAGEAGHIRLNGYGPAGYGKAGSFEGFCSGGGIARLAATRVLERLQKGERPELCPDLAMLDSLDCRRLNDFAQRGDELALSIWKEAGEWLGKGVSILVDLLNPQLVVIGSVFERCEKFLAPSMEAVLAEECLPLSRQVCRVVPAQLGDAIGDYAALGVALLENKSLLANRSL